MNFAEQKKFGPYEFMDFVIRARQLNDFQDLEITKIQYNVDTPSLFLEVSFPKEKVILNPKAGVNDSPQMTRIMTVCFYFSKQKEFENIQYADKNGIVDHKHLSKFVKFVDEIYKMYEQSIKTTQN